MAKLTDPDSLNQATEIVINTGAKTIQLLIAGNLDDNAPGATSGVTKQAVYSFLKEEWKSDNALNKFKFPLKAFTKNEFQWINGWSPADSQTRQLLRDAGWQETVGAENGDLYAGMISLGNFDATGDQGYFQQINGFNQTTTNFDKTGNVNEAVLIFDASAPTDYTDFFKAFLRIQGKTYDSYNLLSEQGLAALEATLYRFPLSNGTDLDISSTDGLIDADAAVTFTNATDIVNWTAHPFQNGDRIKFTNSGGALPAELSTATTYFIINANANDFQLSTTSGGAVVSFTDDGTGTHTGESVPYNSDGGISLDYLTGDHSVVTTWAATTAYSIGDIVKIVGPAPDRFLRATAAGTSGGSEPTGAGADGTVTWEVDPGERQIGADYYHFSRIIDGNDAARTEIYEWGQRQLRKTTDINADTNGDAFGTVNGNVADELFNFRGADLIMEPGVFIDNLPLSEQNNVAFKPHPVDAAAIVEVTYPFVSVVTFNFSANIVGAADADTRAVAYFTNDDAGDNAGNDFDTAGAIIVDDNGGTDMDFLVTAAQLQKDYDYDGNIQRGAASAGIDAPCTLQMVGLAAYENLTVDFVIPRANVTVNVNANDERNYSNAA